MITKEEFNAYERVRVSGTNMSDVKIVAKMSKLDKAKIKEIMSNYPEFDRQFSKGDD